MAWAYDRRVATIERGGLGLARALGKRDHRRIDQPEVEARVDLLKIGRAAEIIDRQRCQPIGAALDVFGQQPPSRAIERFVIR